MSEYQYYEFIAIDAPLDASARSALRKISSRARITATLFVNHYDWGDLKGDPRQFMERWFDLHLYFANWGTRRLMMRWPERLIDPRVLKPFLGKVEGVELWSAGRAVILDIHRDDENAEFDYDDDSGDSRLAELAPLRGAVASGDLRLFYLLWLMAVQDGDVGDDVVEPLPGIAPPDAALEAFADFFRLDPDLMRAASEQGAAAPPRDDLRRAVAALPDADKAELLLRVAEGDASVTATLVSRARAASRLSTPSRTAGDLRVRARAIAEARERAAAERREATRRRKEREAAAARRVRLDALRERGEAVWREVDAEIARRNPKGYDRAISLLSDLRALAAERRLAGRF